MRLGKASFSTPLKSVSVDIRRRKLLTLVVVSLPLNQPVLVLNRLWQAVNVCSVRRAVGLLFIGHGQVVYNDDADGFQTFSFGEWQGSMPRRSARWGSRRRRTARRPG